MLRYILYICLLSTISTCMMAQPAKEEEGGLMPVKEIYSRVRNMGQALKLDSMALSSFDKIITYEKEVYIGKIYNITFTDVRFTCPPDDHLNGIPKSRISQILYADGRRDVFIPLEGRTVKQKELVDTTRIIVKTQKDWMRVIVTEDPAYVQDLLAMGAVKATYEAAMGNIDNEELMQKASVILRKKAAALKAHCVLIDTKFFKKSYGELPRVEVTARVFGY